jgi:excisionase family DNA binding protein
VPEREGFAKGLKSISLKSFDLGFQVPTDHRLTVFDRSPKHTSPYQLVTLVLRSFGIFLVTLVAPKWLRGSPLQWLNTVPSRPRKRYWGDGHKLVSTIMTTVEDLRKRKGLAGVPEVCQVLGKSRNTIFSLIKGRRLKAYRIGNTLMVDRVDLAAFLEARRVG